MRNTIGPAHPDYVPTTALTAADTDRCATCGRHYQEEVQ